MTDLIKIQIRPGALLGAEAEIIQNHHIIIAELQKEIEELKGKVQTLEDDYDYRVEMRRRD